MLLSILLITLLAMNITIGLHLSIKDIRKKWKEINIFGQRKMSVGILIFKIIFLPFSAIFLPWRTLSNLIKDKLINSHPYLANILAYVLMENVLPFVFLYGTVCRFFPSWGKSEPLTAASYFFYAAVIAMLFTIAIVETYCNLRKQTREKAQREAWDKARRNTPPQP